MEARLTAEERVASGGRVGIACRVAEEGVAVSCRVSAATVVAEERVLDATRIRVAGAATGKHIARPRNAEDTRATDLILSRSVYVTRHVELRTRGCSPDPHAAVKGSNASSR